VPFSPKRSNDKPQVLKFSSNLRTGFDRIAGGGMVLTPARQSIGALFQADTFHSLIHLAKATKSVTFLKKKLRNAWFTGDDDARPCQSTIWG
jgi:hypothetical protein